jgi:hypothetical protein
MEPLYCTGCGVELGYGCECESFDLPSGPFCDVCGGDCRTGETSCEYCAGSPLKEKS